MSIEKTIILNVENDEAVKDIQEVNSELDNTSKATDGITTSAIASVKSFKVMGVSINGVSKALKLLKISLIATGIGAIVVVIGTLAAAFLSTQQGIDKVNSVLKPLGAVLETIWGIVQNLGKGLFQMVNGDISGGFDTMADSVENLGDQLEDAWERGKKLHLLMIDIRNQELNQITAVAELTRQIAKQRFIAEDTTKSYVERKKALDLVLSSEASLVQIQKVGIEQRIEAIELERENSDNLVESDKELISLKAELIDIETRQFERSKEARNQLNSLDREYQFTPEGEREKAEEIWNVKYDAAEIEVQINQDKNDAIIQSEKERIEAEQKLAWESAKVKEIITKQEKQFALDSAQNLMFALEQIAGEGTALSKALGIGNVIIDGARAIISTWAGYSSMGPWGVAGAIAQTTAIAAMGVASVAKISSVQPPTIGGGSNSVSPLSSQSVPAPQFNVVGTSDTNQLAQTVSQQTTEPVKAYVVSTEVTTQQSLDRNIESQASFG